MKWALRVLVAVLGVIGLASVGWFWSAAHYEELFEERVDRLRAAGEEVEPADLNAPPVPDAENAAPLLLEAKRLFAGLGPHPADPSPAYLRKLEPYYQLLFRAAERPHCRFGQDWSRPWTVRVESGAILNDARRALGWRVAAGMDAPRCCETLWRLSGCLDGRFLITCFNAWFLREQVCAWLERIAPGPGAIALRGRFEPLLRDEEFADGLVEAMEAERIVHIAITRAMSSGEVRSDAGLPFSIGDEMETTVSRPFAYRRGLDVLVRASALIDLVRRDPDAALAEAAKATDRTYDRIVAAMLEKRRELLARLRITRIGLAVLAHRAKTARWPASLAPLFPDGIPEDPFTEQPFAYHPGERIASAGAGIQWEPR